MVGLQNGFIAIQNLKFSGYALHRWEPHYDSLLPVGEAWAYAIRESVIGTCFCGYLFSTKKTAGGRPPGVWRPIRYLKVERVMGIEPTSKAWEAFVLPLNYTRKSVETAVVS